MHGRYVTDILKICMNNLNAEKIILTNLQGFLLHMWGVYCKPCLQPISCLQLSQEPFPAF